MMKSPELLRGRAPSKSRSKRQLAMKRLIATFLGCLFIVSTQGQQVSQSPTEFIVLRTHRVVTHGDDATLNCSIVGAGNAAQVTCTYHAPPKETGSAGGGFVGGFAQGMASTPKVHYLALVVGSDHVGYVISCRAGLLSGCQPLSTGQVLRGFVQGEKLSVFVDTKAKTYTVETSAYIGPLTQKESPSESTSSPKREELGTEPSVRLAVEKSGKSASSPSGQADQPAYPANAAKVMVSSEPSGADIYVDGNFMGSTPSQIPLPAGSHTVRIEAKGQKPWGRTVTLTAGGDVTLQAVLSAVQ
jgi:PEGA domain